MSYIIPVAIVFFAVIIKLVAKRFELKIVEILCNVAITIGTIVFIYLYAKYLGYDLIEIAKIFLEI